MNFEDLDLAERRVWLRAFYGFDPEGAGYIGFTHEAQRQDMMDRMQDGDLVLIYGAVEDLTDQNLRAQALGFLEVELQPCGDRDRMSDEAYQWKLDRGFMDRWTHGITVRRAWRVRNRVHISTIAPNAYDSRNRFTRTTRAILLDPAERDRALSHPVYQVNVFGEPPIADADLRKGTITDVLTPSRGIPPALGQRTSNYEDGANVLYLMMLTAHADVLLARGAATFGHALAKVGRTNDIVRRLKELNFGFPERSAFCWKAVATHDYPTVAAAHDAETELKEVFARRFRSQGSEFYTGHREQMAAAFHSFCTAGTPRILGAPGRAKGI